MKDTPEEMVCCPFVNICTMRLGKGIIHCWPHEKNDRCTTKPCQVNSRVTDQCQCAPERFAIKASETAKYGLPEKV